MRKAPLLAALLIAGTAHVFAGSSTSTQVENPTGPDDLTSGSLVEIWSQRHLSLQQGNSVAAEESLENLRLQRRVNGVTRSEDVAGAFVLEGYQQLELSNHGAAGAAFRLAVEFDSQMPAAWIGLARTFWASGAGLGATLRALRGATNASLSSWQHRSLVGVTLLWSGVLGIILASILLLVLLFFKTFRIIHHDLTESLCTWLPPATAATIAAIVPFLPLALPWGAAWTPLFWLVLMLPMLSRSERLATASLVMVAAVVAIILPFIARAAGEASDPRLIQIAGASQGAVSADRHRAIQELLGRSPDDAVLQLLLADQDRGFGRTADAIAGYRRATELDPSLSHAFNNAGTLYFELGRYATAAGEFRRAIEANPDHMVAHYNLYLTQEHRFDFAAAEATLRAAQSRNVDAMTALLSEREEGDERLDIVEDHLPVTVALAHAREALEPETESAFSSRAFLDNAAAFLFPIAALFLGAWRLKIHQPPVRCVTCGRIACRHCSLSLEDAQRCATCLSLATSATSLPRRARQKKRREMEAFRLRWNRGCRLSAALLPGGGQIWSGRPILGGILLTVACCGLAAVVIRNVMPVAAYTPTSGEPQVAFLVGISMLVAMWLLGLVLPTRPQTQALGSKV